MFKFQYGRARRKDVTVGATRALYMYFVDDYYSKVDRAEGDLAAQIQAEPPAYAALEPALAKSVTASPAIGHS